MKQNKKSATIKKMNKYHIPILDKVVEANSVKEAVAIATTKVVKTEKVKKSSKKDKE